MSVFANKIQSLILPIGFIVIISLMIGSLFVTTSTIDSNQNEINDIQKRSHSINTHLATMSNAVLKQTTTILDMFQISDYFDVDQLKKNLSKETTRFESARKKLVALNLLSSKTELLSKQLLASEKNQAAITKMVSLLQYNNTLEALRVLNTSALPKTKEILNILDKLTIEAQKSDEIKLTDIDKIAHDEIRNILFFNLIAILLTIALMVFLINEQKKSKLKLLLLANTDTLTELPNRNNFTKSVDALIKKKNFITKNTNSIFSVVFFDIDYFKSINDNYGHKVGDEVLHLFASKLHSMISKHDILSRFGGDEFVLLLNHKSNKDIRKHISAISKALDTTFKVGNDEIFITSSMGVSTYPDGGSDTKELLKNADIAMYDAKQAGRNCFKFYSLESTLKIEQEHNISHSLLTILKNNNDDNQLSLRYQPLVSIDDEDFYDCEALLRWKDLNGNTICTDDFIEISEKSNIIEKINKFVINEACKQQYQWQKEGLANIRIHINLTGNRRVFSEIFDYFSEKLYEYNLSPELFGVELTERTVYEVAKDPSNNSLEKFRNLGLKISIDDFGTGYSSLSYLKNLPITTVKIDRSFIQGLPNEKVDTALVKAIITLAHSLDYEVVAEGIENKEQLDFLKSCNCNIAQGYLLHRPMTSDNISQLKLVA